MDVISESINYFSNKWHHESECILNCDEGYSSSTASTKCLSPDWSVELQDCVPKPSCDENEEMVCKRPDCQETCRQGSNVRPSGLN